MQTIQLRDPLWRPLDLTDADSLEEIASVEIEAGDTRIEVDVDPYGAVYCELCDEDDCKHEIAASRTLKKQGLLT